MSTTIQAERPGTQVLPPSVERRIPTVPDHVPPEIAAEHSDAAAVVSARPTGTAIVARCEPPCSTRTLHDFPWRACQPADTNARG